MARIQKIERTVTVVDETDPNRTFYTLSDNGNGTVTLTPWVEDAYKNRIKGASPLTLPRDDFLRGFIALWPDEVAIIASEGLVEDD